MSKSVYKKTTMTITLKVDVKGSLITNAIKVPSNIYSALPRGSFYVIVGKKIRVKVYRRASKGCILFYKTV